jgi:hypothetical protein
MSTSASQLPAREPSLGDSLKQIMSAHTDDFHVAIPGFIDKWDGGPVADCIPAAVKVYLAADGVSEVNHPYPVLTNVPIVFPRGGGGFISFPLKKGDPVLLVFSQTSLDAWLESDGKTQLDPQDSRRHHISDAVAHVGLQTTKNFIPNASKTDVVIGLEDGSSELHIQPDGEIYWKYGHMKFGGSGASDPLAKGNETESRLSAIESRLVSLCLALVPFAAISFVPVIPFIPDISNVKSNKMFTDS